MARRRKKESTFEYLSNQNGEMYDEYTRLVYHYKTLALNRYKWENLPKGIESRYIEEALLMKGQAFFVDDPNIGFLCLGCHPTNALTVYGEPTSVMVMGTNYTKEFGIDDGVRILNNDLAMADIHHILHFAERMAELDDKYTSNMRQQIISKIFVTTKENELSVKNYANKLMAGDPVVIVDKSMTTGSNGVIPVEVTTNFLLDKLQQADNELERKLYSFLGINTTMEKKERLLVDETNSNNAFIEMMLDIGLKNRKLACERINEMYGLNIEVKATLHEVQPYMEKDGGVDYE